MSDELSELKEKLLKEICDNDWEIENVLDGTYKEGDRFRVELDRYYNIKSVLRLIVNRYGRRIRRRYKFSVSKDPTVKMSDVGDKLLLEFPFLDCNELHEMKILFTFKDEVGVAFEYDATGGATNQHGKGSGSPS